MHHDVTQVTSLLYCGVVESYGCLFSRIDDRCWNNCFRIYDVGQAGGDDLVRRGALQLSDNQDTKNQA